MKSWKLYGAGVVLTVAVAIGGMAGCSKPTPVVVKKVELPNEDTLCDRIDAAVKFAGTQRHLDTKDQAAWQVVHGALAYGRDFQIYHDGKLVGAIDYLLGGGELRGWVLRKGDHGVLAVLEPGSKTGQGHPDQWLGYLSQCGLKPEDSIVVGGETFKLADLITQAQWDIYDGMEATWTLMAFGTYLPLESDWTAKDGTKWTIDRIVGMEADQDLSDSACGGTHRMYALAKALNRYLENGGQLTEGGDGSWERAARKIDGAVDTIHKFQQPDGSFSTNYFTRAATSPDLSDRISTTGHSLEFLTVALDDDELEQPWVTRAVVHLLDCLEKTQNFDLECGALYHASHGLDLYRARRFGPRQPVAPSEPDQPAANASTASRP